MSGIYRAMKWCAVVVVAAVMVSAARFAIECSDGLGAGHRFEGRASLLVSEAGTARCALQVDLIRSAWVE